MADKRSLVSCLETGSLNSKKSELSHNRLAEVQFISVSDGKRDSGEILISCLVSDSGNNGSVSEKSHFEIKINKDKIKLEKTLATPRKWP